MNRRLRWLTAAGALFGLVAWLSPRDVETDAPERDEVVFRRGATRDELARMERRRTLPAFPAQPADAPAMMKRDPVLTALPSGAGSVVVFEAAAFFSLPVGQLFLNCIQGARGLEEEGFDVTKVDRVAFARLDEHRTLTIVSGEADAFPEPEAEVESTYGEHARMFAQADAGPNLAQWNDNLMLFADDPGDLRDAVDRLEGRKTEPEAIDVNESYGEIHGRLDARTAVQMLPPDIGKQVELGDLRFQFHVDATEDLLVTFDAAGEPAIARDVGRAFSSALALLRVEAKTSGKDQLARLLDQYTVRNEPNGFQLEAALPVELARELLSNCNVAHDAGLAR